MPSQLDHELKKIVLGTNDQRRRVGQAFYHFYRTLIFWNEKDVGFLDITRAWSVGGAEIFDGLATALRDLEVFGTDTRLRQWLAEVLGQLAGDLERGDAMLFPFLRWLEGRFPTLTTMMQEEQSGSKIWDYELARRLAHLFTLTAGADRRAMVDLLRAEADQLTDD